MLHKILRKVYVLYCIWEKKESRGCINHTHPKKKKFVVNEKLNRHNAQVYSNQFCLSSQEEMRFLFFFLKREVTQVN